MKVILILLITFLTGCEYNIPITKVIDTKPKNEICLEIMTTNKLVYNMVKDIVKEKHFVDFIFRNESDQWNFDYSQDSLENISKQDLFFYVGAGFEPWANKFVGNLKKDSVGVVNISRGATLLTYKKEVKYKDEILKDNPYYFVSLDNYKITLLNIKNAIEDKDPQNRDFYEKNFSNALKQIDEQSKKLSVISQKTKEYIYLVDGEELDYFIKYNNFKSLNVDNYNTLAPKDQEEKATFEKKLSDAKGVIFLYKSEQELKSNEELINKYSMKVVNIQCNKDGTAFSEVLKTDVENLERILDNK